MVRSSHLKVAHFAIFIVFVLTVCTQVMAETAKVEGLIIGRSGDEIIVQFASGAELAFQLTDATEVSQVGGPGNCKSTDNSWVVLLPR